MKKTLKIMTINLNRVDYSLYIVTIACCLLALVLVPLVPSIGRKLFYFSCYISLAGLLINIKKLKNSIKKEDILISTSFFIFGIVNILWVLIYKPTDNYSPIYPIFMKIGEILVISSLLFLYLSTNRTKCNISAYIFLIGITINSYVFYEYFIKNISRAELGTERATIAAYIISIISSLVLSTILKYKNKFKFHIAFFYFIFSFSAIILTQTRAAIILFPILSLLTILTNTEVSKKNIIKTTCILLAILIGLGFLFKTTLEVRYNEMKNDIVLYQELNSNSSIGARFAMATVGLKIGANNIFGQSAEDRIEKVNQIIAKDESLSGAGIYTNIHLHNEIIDNLSIKGIFGVISLLFFYISLLYSSLRNGINIPMLIITLSAITYGLSDVLFFSKEFTFTFILCIVISKLLNNKNSEINYEKK
ncbi:O-antigen ligase family protein [Budvicia aquatica]|uniref:O-antigen ligase family protein n=1 Tax=Budvicia aquatica TaxID=82979 RepID=UPI0021C343E6|nr:O-antigen ligase family protein [Budvicia aquatica]